MDLYQILFQVKWFQYLIFIQIEEIPNKLSVDKALKIILMLNYSGI